LIVIEDWGLIDYEKALKKQENLVEIIAQKKLPGTIVFCTHPPIVTLGRKTQEGDVFAWEGPICEVSRGGRATYHGPSQLIVYPILNLDLENQKWPKQDLGYFLKNLENSIIETLKTYGVESIGKSLQTTSGEATGVWVGEKKIASLGIGVRKWVTYHGAAINLDDDPKAFFGMNPCGFKKEIMVSLGGLLGRKVDRNEFQSRLEQRMKERF